MDKTEYRNVNVSAFFFFPSIITTYMFIYFPICRLRGQSPMHVLGHYGKENAAAIFELFLECMPEYPLDKPDNEGNTGTVAAFNPHCWLCSG